MTDTKQDAMSRRIAKTEEQKKADEMKRIEAERKKLLEDDGDTTVAEAVPMA